jgi:Pro-kumamolisin, activation domain
MQTTRSISLFAALLLILLLFGGIAFADSTVTYPEHVDHPELYPLPAPAKKNIEIVISLKTPVTAEDVQEWSDWLQEQGFRIGDTGNGWMDAYVNIEDAETAFQTQIMMTREGSYGNLSDPNIPARFANVVQSISGLTEGFLGTYGPARRAQPKPMSQPSSRNSSSSETPTVRIAALAEVSYKA